MVESSKRKTQESGFTVLELLVALFEALPHGLVAAHQALEILLDEVWGERPRLQGWAACAQHFNSGVEATQVCQLPLRRENVITQLAEDEHPHGKSIRAELTESMGYKEHLLHFFNVYMYSLPVSLPPTHPTQPFWSSQSTPLGFLVYTQVAVVCKRNC